MRSAALALLLFAAACAERATPAAVGYASRGPGPAYACLAPRLTGPFLRTETEPTADGWRMRVDVLSGPPAGWYRKGRIEYAGGAVTFVPDTATTGIAEDAVRQTIHPALRVCGGREGRKGRL